MAENEPRTNDTVPPKGVAVFVSDNVPEPSSRRAAPRALLVWSVAGAVILAAVAAPAYWFVLRPKLQGQPGTVTAKQYESARSNAYRLDDLHEYSKEVAVLADQQKALSNQKTGRQYADTTLALGNALYGDKKYDEAIAQYMTIKDDDLRGIEAKMGIGKAYLAQGKNTEARNYIQQAVDTAREKAKTDPDMVFKLNIYESQLNAVPQ